jgi:hypothetical protein
MNLAPPRRDWTKWLTASVGVATAITGIIQFYYKEIFAPAKVPVNIALGLEISPLKPDKTNEGDVIPAFMQIKISNTGNKSVYLKGPIWTAFGMYRNSQPRSPGAFSIPTSLPKSLQAWCPEVKNHSGGAAEDAFVQCWNQKMAPLNADNYLQVFADRIEFYPPKTTSRHNFFRELIATGPVGKDSELKPGQEVESHILIPVSTKPQYDYLEAVIAVPTVSGIPSEQADSIASVAFINLQKPSPGTPKIYHRLTSFCLTKPRPSSLVNVLDAFKLPRRDEAEVGNSLGTQISGNCYTSAGIPRGTLNQRLIVWVTSILTVSEFDRFGAQFYDATYEVPLYPYGETGPAMKGAGQP